MARCAPTENRIYGILVLNAQRSGQMLGELPHELMRLQKFA